MPYAKEIMDLRFIQDKSSYLSNLIVRYMPGLWTALANMLVFYLIDRLARLRRYSDYISYQRFVGNVSIFYFFVNMLLLPLVSISANANVYKLAQKFFTWDRFSQTFLYLNSGMNL